MADLLRTRFTQGAQTIAFPPDDAALPARFRGRPELACTACRGAGCELRAADAPSDMIVADAAGHTMLDAGAALYSPDEASGTPSCRVTFTNDYRLAARSRGGLVSRTGAIEHAGALDREMLRLFGRSLRLRSVSAGSCAGCEAELVALGNVVFDLSRFGVQFVASPRHADGLIVTGTVNVNMRSALERTFAATPDPKLGSSEAGNGIDSILPVDLWIAGCPPHPLTILDGLLRLLGRLGTSEPVSGAHRTAENA
jgi:Ni,Fe-hydrogenase III small subunit